MFPVPDHLPTFIANDWREIRSLLNRDSNGAAL
jgi:hypothetical protein